jgi:DNA-directed RNA polymerase specialized sigma24 family protein
VLTAAASLMLVLLLRRPPSQLVPELPPSFTPDRFLPADDPNWPGHWMVPPTDWADAAATDIESNATLVRVRDAIGELPSPYRDVIVHRDVEGLPVADVGDAVGRDSAAVRELLNEARGQVRARLERYFDEETT